MKMIFYGRKKRKKNEKKTACKRKQKQSQLQPQLPATTASYKNTQKLHNENCVIKFIIARNQFVASIVCLCNGVMVDFLTKYRFFSYKQTNA